jgi:hypothetical protein
MDTCLNSFSTIDRYDDGVAVDYAFMIRMWSAFDRSLTAFERKVGLPRISAVKLSRRTAAREPELV